jgi:hypothetical protein
VQLHPLQQLVHVERGLAGVEAGYDAERHLAGPIGYMKVPPKALSGTGQPSVCTTRSSGRLTSQTSLTPSA